MTAQPTPSEIIQRFCDEITKIDKQIRLGFTPFEDEKKFYFDAIPRAGQAIARAMLVLDYLADDLALAWVKAARAEIAAILSGDTGKGEK